MKRAVILLGILIASFNSYAQKVKYKDLYVLLRARNYEAASGFLVTFLTQEPEHPNANYQMGLMLEYKLKELDLLKETEPIIQRADSAILYFDKAKGLIDDKDIKKHDDDYYELFKRRNLRTGKFEVILSDIQLDIEKRVEALKALKKDVASVKKRFENSIAYYESAQTGYKTLKDGFGDVLTLTLGATDSATMLLDAMVSQYDSSLTNFKIYTNLRKDFEGSSYDEIKVDLKPIEGFSEEALESPDFYSKKVDLFNFKSWSIDQQSQIKANKEFMANLIAFDESLDKMSKDIETDSVDLSKEVFGMITSPVLKELKLVDYESWLMTLLQYKISQLNLESAWMGWYKEAADTLDVGYQLGYATKIHDQLAGVEKLEKQLQEASYGPFFKRYQRFVDARYTTESELKKYVASQSAIVKAEDEKIHQLEDKLRQRDQWALWKQDSISLSIRKDTLGYATLFSDSLADRRFVVAGLTLKEEAPKLYFTTVPSSRVLDTLYYAPVEMTGSLDLDSLQTISGKSANGHYALLVLNTSAPFKGTLLFASQETGIEWSAKLEDLTVIPTLTLSDESVSVIQEGSEPIVYSLDGNKVEGGG